MSDPSDPTDPSDASSENSCTFCYTRLVSRITRNEFLRVAGAAASAGVFTALTPRKSASAAARPANILFFFPDQWRPDWHALNPSIPVRTPTLARLAREGVWFDRAYCPSPLCAPSRACIAQGLEYRNAGVRDNGESMPTDTPTLYKLLNEAGYRVGSVGKLDLRKPAHDWGPDGMHRVDGHVWFNEWGFTDGLDSEGKGDSFNGISHEDDAPVGNSPYTKMLMDRRDGSLERYIQWRDDRNKFGPHSNYAFTTPIELADEAYNDNWVGQNGLDVLRAFPGDTPWFLQANFPGPHPPLDITPPMADWYRDATFDQPFANTQLRPEVHLEIRRNYTAMIENIDRWFAQYVKALEDRGEAENTLIVFSSDHGEMLGDHDLWGKRFPYEPSAAVPLMAWGAGVRKGYRHSGPAETLDVTATFLDYAGVPVPGSMDSRSMRPLLAGATDAHRDVATSALLGWRLACDGRYKLMQGYDPEKGVDKDAGPAADVLLFDLKSDPVEAHNVASSHPDIVARLSAHLG